jgi:glyoxylase-like metal-dependent hydrolase (beta-lactamase superfamily II)
MLHSSLLRLAGAALLLAFSSVAIPAQAADPVTKVQLYALECGLLHANDLSIFSDTFEYNGKPGVLSDPCFVIRHPKGILLWDTGLGDKLAETKGGVDFPLGHMQVDVTLLDQLKQIGLSPSDITYLAFSHTHFDHTGNANEFPDATWILNQTELDWDESKAAGGFVDVNTFSAYKNAKKKMISGDEDVFGDGSVVILKTPGHTPGHQSLMLKLKKSGVVILSGDLFHQRDNYRFRRVPSFNVSRADTLASIDRVDTILKNTKGRLVVQHDLGDFKSLPKFPKYLD